MADAKSTHTYRTEATDAAGALQNTIQAYFAYVQTLWRRTYFVF